MDSTKCPACGNEYSQLGNHWQHSPQHRPKLTEYQHEVATGLLMGDGNICIRDGMNPYLQANMITPKYLEYLDDVFGVLSTGVRKMKSETSDNMFSWKTRSIAEFKAYETWYNSGSKKWPRELELTPTILKHLYCCDGHFSENSGSRYVSISASNERHDTDYLSNLFTNVDLPEPTVSVYERNDGKPDDCVISFSTHDNDQLFSYMGEPLPGFEYKWSDKFK
jgi:hypothetical protein